MQYAHENAHFVAYLKRLLTALHRHSCGEVSSRQLARAVWAPVSSMIIAIIRIKSPWATLYVHWNVSNSSSDSPLSCDLLRAWLKSMTAFFHRTACRYGQCSCLWDCQMKTGRFGARKLCTRVWDPLTSALHLSGSEAVWIVPPLLQTPNRRRSKLNLRYWHTTKYHSGGELVKCLHRKHKGWCPYV